MKILFINSVFGKGSTGRIVQDIGSVLEQQGHEYRALYGRSPISNDPHAVYIDGFMNAEWHAAMSRITDKTGFYSKSATKKALDFIRGYNPDVIHLHNLHGYYINIELLFQYLKEEFRGRVIWTLHDCWAFTGHCVHYLYANCDKWKVACGNCPEKRRYPASFVADNSKQNFKHKKETFLGVKDLIIVTPSKWLSDQVKGSFLKEYPVCVVNNGIDLEIFSPCYEAESEKYILNVVDGLDERKGFSDLVELSKKISSEYSVIMIGVNEKDLKNIPSTIKAVCRTNNQKELADYYRKASYFINLTYEDTFPTVNIEALACGTPVITYNSGGSAEILDHDSGCVVAPGNLDSIIELLGNGMIFNRKKCRERASRYDKWDKYKEYVELYMRRSSE